MRMHIGKTIKLLREYLYSVNKMLEKQSTGVPLTDDLLRLRALISQEISDLEDTELLSKKRKISGEQLDPPRYREEDLIRAAKLAESQCTEHKWMVVLFAAFLIIGYFF